jgi:hypothetical protein
MFLRDSAESETLTSRLVMKRGGSGVVVEEINRPRPPRSPLLLLPGGAQTENGFARNTAAIHEG